MFNNKALFGFLLSVALLAVQATAVYAAPASQTATSGSCTIQSIATSTSSGALVVTVTCTDGSTVDFNEADAAALGLITQNADGSITVNDTTMVGQTIDTTGASDPCAASASGDTTGGATTTSTTSSTGEESTGETSSANPVAQALCGFFGISYDTIQTYQGEGAGYGVIAQACFMAQVLGDDCTDVLDAKVNNDYGQLFPDGSVTNWGQLRKAVFNELLGNGPRSSHNLGWIMSGKAEGQSTSEAQSTGAGSSSGLSPADVHGKGQGGKGGGHGHGHGNGHGKP